MVPQAEAAITTTEDSVETTGGNAHRVYVGNLAWKVQWQDLKDHMRQLGGNVIRADVFEDQHGRSRGCGLVEYETADEAREAIEKLTDTDLFERKIFVREDREDAKPRRAQGHSPRGGRGGSRGGRGGSGGRGGYRGGSYNGGFDDGYRRPPRTIPSENKDCQVFIGNLAYKSTWRDLKDLFNEDGSVVRADVYEQNGRSRGCGTVLFKAPDDAQAAIDKYNEYDFMGRNILVRLDAGPPAPKAKQF